MRLNAKISGADNECLENSDRENLLTRNLKIRSLHKLGGLFSSEDEESKC